MQLVCQLNSDVTKNETLSTCVLPETYKVLNWLCNLTKLSKKNPHNHSDEWLAADVSEFVIGNPQTQEHPRINLDKNTQSEVSFHMVGSLVAGLYLCLFKGFRGPDFIFAGYFEETHQRWILSAKTLVL